MFLFSKVKLSFTYMILKFHCDKCNGNVILYMGIIHLSFYQGPKCKFNNRYTGQGVGQERLQVTPMTTPQFLPCSSCVHTSFPAKQVIPAQADGSSAQASALILGSKPELRCRGKENVILDSRKCSNLS